MDRSIDRNSKTKTLYRWINRYIDHTHSNYDKLSVGSQRRSRMVSPAIPSHLTVHAPVIDARPRENLCGSWPEWKDELDPRRCLDRLGKYSDISKISRLLHIFTNLKHFNMDTWRVLDWWSTLSRSQ